MSVIVTLAAAASADTPGAVSNSIRTVIYVPTRCFDVVQDRAFAFGTRLAAGFNQKGECVAHAGEFVDAQRYPTCGLGHNSNPRRS